MKRIISMLFIVTLLLSAYPSVMAEASYTMEWLGDGTELAGEGAKPLLAEYYDQHGKWGYILELNGESYIVGRRGCRYTLPIKLGAPFNQYIWTGQYYMVRDDTYDGVWPGRTMPKLPIRFYDADMNLVYEHTFDFHVAAIGYFNGRYYCQSYSVMYPEVYCSTDMVNWEKTDESIPRQTEAGLTYAGNKVALGGTELLPIDYEDGREKEFWSTYGNWILKVDEDYHFYLSNDNVYFAKLPVEVCPIEHQDTGDSDYCPNTNMIHREIFERHNLDLLCVYEHGTDLVIDFTKNYSAYGDVVLRLTMPKQPIYDELERQKNAPYVKVADEILGFETAPIMEEDRTLVPMRFLFEKLGAEVTWDQATMTATAQKENTTINFSINQTNAVVNGANEQMDVPARLVNDKTMVPLRFLSEELGYEVDWNQELRMATIETNTGDAETANETGIALFFKNIGQTIAGWFNA